MAPTTTKKARKSKAPQRDVAQDITNLIIAQLEAGTVPWQKPWRSTGGSLPRSMSTGRLYRGMNSILLGMYASASGYTSPWWGTFKQVQALGGHVNAGESASLVILYRTFTKEEEAPNGETVTKTIPLLRGFHVFNASQCSELPEKYTKVPERTGEHTPIEEAETIVEGYVTTSGLRVKVSDNDRAYYSPLLDLVSVPEPEDFRSPEAYYSTTFHELTHSTGHKSRLNREGIVEGHRFGDALYAAEELVAEMGAAMLCAMAGVDQAATIPASAAYIANWLTALRNDKKLVLSAAGKAQKAAFLIAPEAEGAVTEEVAV